MDFDVGQIVELGGFFFWLNGFECCGEIICLAILWCLVFSLMSNGWIIISALEALYLLNMFTKGFLETIAILSNVLSYR